MEENPAASIWQHLTLVLSKDGLVAVASASARVKVSDGLRASHIRNWLAQQGVAHGIDEAAVEELAARLRGGKEAISKLVIARGTPAVAGEDGFVRYHFRTALEAGKVSQQNDHVDFRERGMVNNTAVGMVLAELVAPGPGTPGMTVKSETIQPDPGKPARAPTAGDGVEVSEDSTVFKALIEGHAQLAANQITVLRQLHIEGNIDYSVGNIDFVGDLFVSGLVLSGFEVKVKGSVIISGSIERQALIVAGGDVTVENTIRCGRERPGVEAGGTVRARRLENAWIKARGDVVVAEEILNSKVACYGRFLGAGAEVRGCEIEAVAGIEVGQAGSRDGAANHFAAAITLEVAKAIDETRAKSEELRKSLTFINNSFHEKYGRFTNQPELLEGLPAQERQDFEQALGVHHQRCEAIQDRIRDMEARIQELDGQMAESPGALIAISRRLHPVCTICLRRNEWVVRSPLDQKVFYDDEKNNRIGMRSYKQGLLDEERAEGQDEADEAAIKELDEQVNSRRISPADLGNRLNSLAGEGSPHLSALLRIGLQALGQKRFKTPDVHAGVALLLCRLAGERETLESRLELASKALVMLKKVFAEDNLHAYAYSTTGLIFDLLGRHEQALEKHRRAVYATKVQKGKWNEAEVRARCVQCLLAVAATAGEKGNADITRSALDEAGDLVEGMLAGNPDAAEKKRFQLLRQRIESARG